MSTFIHTLAEHAYQNRTVALVEAGSWAPAAAKVMTKELEGMKDITLTQNKVTVLGSLNDASRARSRPSPTSFPSSDTFTSDAQPPQRRPLWWFLFKRQR